MCACAPLRYSPPPFQFASLARRTLVNGGTTLYPSKGFNPLSLNSPCFTFGLVRSSPLEDFESNGRASAGSSEQEVPSSFDFLELKRELDREKEKEEKLDALEGSRNSDLEKKVRSGRRQMIRRSSLLAKQVISMQSARSLGFVSQLWVDPSTWVVALVEVRPNLLLGEMEKFLLEDIHRVGDVVLVPDESVLDNELKIIRLDSLVGYTVVTTGRRNVGKVRGYTFNINSGTVESLELDSFGLSIVPSSLVSTYCLLVEDVLEVVSDKIIVHEDSVSQLQRLTKGIWGNQGIHGNGEQMDDYYEFGRKSNREKSSSRRFRRRMRDFEDDWDLPMDY